MKNTALYVGIGLAAVGFGTSFYFSTQEREKGRIGKLFLAELNKVVNPESIGLANSNAFDVNFIDRVINEVNGRIAALQTSAANQLAERIHKAWDQSWLFGNNKANAVYAVLRSLKDKVQVSQVAKAYQTRYGVNLIDKIKDELSAEEVTQVNQIVDKMDNYRTVA